MAVQSRIFISHSEVSLPIGAKEVDVDIISTELLANMCAEHTPIQRQDLYTVWVLNNRVYAQIPGKEGEEFGYYRTEATWM